MRCRTLGPEPPPATRPGLPPPPSPLVPGQVAGAGGLEALANTAQVGPGRRRTTGITGRSPPLPSSLLGRRTDRFPLFKVWIFSRYKWRRSLAAAAAAGGGEVPLSLVVFSHGRDRGREGEGGRDWIGERWGGGGEKWRGAGLWCCGLGWLWRTAL